MATLDELISARLAQLSLPDDDDSREFVSGIVQEDSFEQEVSTTSSEAHPSCQLQLVETLIQLMCV